MYSLFSLLMNEWEGYRIRPDDHRKQLKEQGLCKMWLFVQSHNKRKIKIKMIKTVKIKCNKNLYISKTVLSITGDDDSILYRISHNPNF